ncbi:MAG: hypothetical protein O7F76_07000 [Planctomycetota bacterium]|nr:hypothetical protein [Planctomycetota bacterium]
MPTPRTLPTYLNAVRFVLAPGVLLAVSSSVGRGFEPPPTTQPTTASPAELRPPADILRAVSGPEPERQLEGFAAWHEWRTELSGEQRRVADAYFCHPEWLGMLGRIAMYEMEPRRRRRAYVLLGHIGGQRVYPFMLWGLTEDAEEGFLSKFLGTVDPGLTIRRFFKEQGDPTVLDDLPDWRWYDVRRSINNRWQDRPSPKKEWSRIDPEQVLDELGHTDPVLRRLAVRALAINPGYRRSLVARQFRMLLSDTDRGVIHTVVQACEIESFPSTRGRLKALADDSAMPIETRRACLNAIVRCGTARLWTADWMIANIADWPEALDETVLRCLIKLNRGKRSRREQYAASIRQAAERIDDERTRTVVARALEAF